MSTFINSYNYYDIRPTTTLPAQKWPFLADKTELDSEQSTPVPTEGIRYGYYSTYDGYRFTVAYRPSVRGRNSKFMDIAVAVCSPKDNFSKKFGRSLAVSRLLHGEYVTLPVGRDGNQFVPAALATLFSNI